MMIMLFLIALDVKDGKNKIYKALYICLISTSLSDF